MIVYFSGFHLYIYTHIRVLYSAYKVNRVAMCLVVVLLTVDLAENIQKLTSHPIVFCCQSTVICSGCIAFLHCSRNQQTQLP